MSKFMAAPRFVSVDWGTTSFRAALVAADGSISATTESAAGIMSIAAQGFQPVLAREIAPWRKVHGNLPIIMSGMIGSRQGWVEARYLATPVDLGRLGTALTWVDGGELGRIALVPGIETRDGRGVPDVMRGEETQVLGALTATGRQDGLFVLPGTHSKWVTVEGGRLVRFQTFMTGEVFAALKGHTILGRMMSEATQPVDRVAFNSGVADGAGRGLAGDLLNRIFAARTRGLVDGWHSAQLESYLSGLLIGAEIAAAATSASAKGGVTIIANEKLTALYGQAADVIGITLSQAVAAPAIAGHLALVRQGVFEMESGS